MSGPDRAPRSAPAKIAALAVAVAMAAGLAGCNPFRSGQALCVDPEGYQEAQSLPPLKIPPGLEAPDTSNALRIPDLDTPAPPARTRAQGCLDEPPSYIVKKPKPAPEA